MNQSTRFISIFILFLSTAYGHAQPPNQKQSNSDPLESAAKDTLKARLSTFKGLKTDISIGEIDGFPLSINLAMPNKKTAKPRPVLVMIHGGGLIKGTKDLLNDRIQKIAKQGFVGVSVGYRLAPKHRFPAAIEDVKASIRFLKAHAKELHIDPERIIVSGSSAGGYLATMIGVTGNSDKFSKHKLYSKYDSSVKAVTSYSGAIANFNQEKYQNFSLVNRFKRKGVDLKFGLAELSPITYLDENDPPFFLVHGTDDERVPVEMTQGFVRALSDIEHEYEYIEIDGGKHSLKKSRPKKASAAFAKYLGFIKRHGFSKKSIK